MQQNQIVFGRDQALSEQSIEFLQRKIGEMQAMNDEQTQIYESKLQSMKNELLDDGNQQLDRVT